MFGNSIYFTTNNYKKDVIIEAVSGYFFNDKGQSLVKEPFYSNTFIPFDLSFMETYSKQFIKRADGNILPQFLYYWLCLFITVYLLQLLYGLVYGYCYEQQLKAGRKMFAVNKKEPSFTDCTSSTLLIRP